MHLFVFTILTSPFAVLFLLFYSLQPMLSIFDKIKRFKVLQ
nr:MAG TPA: hypothetical protein [Caudoviricetes sp.]